MLSSLIKQPYPNPQRGSALVLVLWVLALLSLLAGGLLVSTGLHNQTSLTDLRNTQALLAAEAGVPLAVQSLQTHAANAAVSQAQTFTLDGAQLSVVVSSEHGKLDLNFCPPDAFARLLRYTGASAEQAQMWALQLQHRRSQGRPLRQLVELLDLPAHDAVIYSRILPWITLWSGRGSPDPAFASEAVRAALKLNLLTGAISNHGSTLAIESQARLPTGEAAVVYATVILDAAGAGGSPYRVLQWRTGPVSSAGL